MCTIIRPIELTWKETIRGILFNSPSLCVIGMTGLQMSAYPLDRFTCRRNYPFHPMRLRGSRTALPKPVACHIRIGRSASSRRVLQIDEWKREVRTMKRAEALILRAARFCALRDGTGDMRAASPRIRNPGVEWPEVGCGRLSTKPLPLRRLRGVGMGPFGGAPQIYAIGQHNAGSGFPRLKPGA
jgi:hypothetical protein